MCWLVIVGILHRGFLASMCWPVIMSVFSDGVRMEWVKMGMLECVWGSQDQWVDNGVFFTHLSLFLMFFMHLFQESPQGNAAVPLLSDGETLEATVGWGVALSIFLFLQLFLCYHPSKYLKMRIMIKKIFFCLRFKHTMTFFATVLAASALYPS